MASEWHSLLVRHLRKRVSPRKGNLLARAPPASGQRLPYRPDRSLGPISNADLAENVLHMLLDRFITDPQRQGNFLVGQSRASCRSTSLSRRVSGTSTSAAIRGVAKAPVTRRSSSRVQVASPAAADRMACNSLSRGADFSR